MAEGGKVTSPTISQELTVGLQNLLAQEEPLLDFLHWQKIPQGSMTYKWLSPSQAPTAAFRAINAAWDADGGIWIPKQETVAILGGELEIDKAILDMMGGDYTTGIRSRQLRAKVLAIKEKWLETFLEGDRGVDAASFEGLRTRVNGTGMDFDMSGSSSTDRAALTLGKIDEVMEAVIGTTGQKVMLTNQWIRRKVNALVRAEGQAREMVSTKFGVQLPAYAEMPMYKIEKRSDMSTILDFDEDPGDGGDDTTSIYIVNFADGEEEGVFGLMGHGGSWEVTPFGEQESVPRNLDRFTAYVGVVTAGNRPFARINSVGKI